MSSYPGVDFNNEQYVFVRELGRGNFGVTVLMRHKQTGEEVAAKIIKRGAQVLLDSACPSTPPCPHAIAAPPPPLPLCPPCCQQRRHSAAWCLQINVNVERELLNHRPLYHPHIIRFQEVRIGTAMRRGRTAILTVRPDAALLDRALLRLTSCLELVRRVVLLLHGVP